ncbi:MAG: hypothetical protein Q9172_003148 [Xanthocarpia lactea]
MASHSPFEIHLVEQKVKTLVNAQLKSILKRERLLVSGLKAAMQTRIVDHTLLKIRTCCGPPARTITPYSLRDLGYLLMFKDSPFYTILQHLTPVQECKVREATRDTIDCRITLKPDVADKLISEPNLRVMVFCASEPISHFSKVDIAFPHQVEIKVNLDEVKASLRGLKNRAGSTRPADITNLLRKRANYENTMTLTYALTHKEFYFVVSLVRQHSVEELVAKLQSGKTISKDQVIKESKLVESASSNANLIVIPVVSKAQDSDVQATGAIISLKCPVSTLRIDVPCRSTVCTHNQCFDASSFLQLQEQAPTWTCPVCNKTVSFEALEIDRYVDDILKSTPRSIDQVTVQPDGKWSLICLSPRPRRDSSGDDEDLVEIKDPPRVTAVKNEITNGPVSMRTPPTSSREQSTTSSVPPPSTGTKRSVSAVIDLISDDEEEIRRPSKKPATPAYLATPTYSGSGSGRAQPLGNGPGSFEPYPGIPPAKPNYIQRGYPRQ